MADVLFELENGRGLGLSAAGDPIARRLVLFCHPAPGSGGFDPDPVVTGGWGVHLLSLDRPGYGSSTPLPPGEHPSVEDRADEIAEYVRRSESSAEEVSRADLGAIGVVGWGLGGQVALSLAARHPDLVDRVAIVGTPAPRSAKQRDGKGAAVEAMPVKGTARIESLAEELAGGPWQRTDALGIDPQDPALDSPGLTNRLGRMLERAEHQGSVGIATDLVMSLAHGWVDELGAITASVKLVYGESDPVADASDGHWLQRRIPDSSVVRVEGAGRLAIVSAWSEILAHVAPHHGGIGEEQRDE